MDNIGNRIKELLDNSKNLTPEQLKAINNLIKAFNYKKQPYYHLVFSFEQLIFKYKVII